MKETIAFVCALLVILGITFIPPITFLKHDTTCVSRGYREAMFETSGWYCIRRGPSGADEIVKE